MWRSECILLYKREELVLPGTLCRTDVKSPLCALLLFYKHELAIFHFQVFDATRELQLIALLI